MSKLSDLRLGTTLDGTTEQLLLLVCCVVLLGLIQAAGDIPVHLQEEAMKEDPSLQQILERRRIATHLKSTQLI